MEQRELRLWGWPEGSKGERVEEEESFGSGEMDVKCIFINITVSWYNLGKFCFLLLFMFPISGH